MTQAIRNFRDLPGPLVFASLISGVSLGILGRATGRSHGRTSAVLKTVDGLLAPCLLSVLLLTLMPNGSLHGRTLNLVPLRDMWRTLTNSIDWSVPVAQLGGNVLPVFPVGLLLALRRPDLRASWMIAALLALTGSIEALQYLLGVGRVASIDDVMLGTLGGFLGCLVGRRVRVVLNHRIPGTVR